MDHDPSPLLFISLIDYGPSFTIVPLVHTTMKGSFGLLSRTPTNVNPPTGWRVHSPHTSIKKGRGLVWEALVSDLRILV
jgi:hypothetical protein